MRIRTSTTTQVKLGDTRVRRVFAWLPASVEGYSVWLESFEVLETYQSQVFDTNIGRFVVSNWVEVSKRLMK